MPEVPGQRQARSQGMSVFAPTEEFVLRALFTLLEAAPNYLITPLNTKLHEFVQWFDGADLPESCFMISARIEKLLRWHKEELQIRKFHKFHCMWYM